MAGGSQSQDSVVGSRASRQKGRATLETLKIGCIAMVMKDGEPRKAEILSIKETKSGRQFYCNFDNFNKRLDEWVPVARFDFSQDVEWPEKPKEVKKAAGTTTKKTVAQKKTQKRPARELSAASETSPSHPWTEFVESQQITPDQQTANHKKGPTPGVDDEDAMDVDEPALEVATRPPEDAGDEIEKLRVGGSMTQNQAEISRIRNISKVQFGRYDLFPWYFSPYPEAFTQEDVIYICEFCLCYYGDLKPFTRHRMKCTLQHPPGNEIYRDDYVSFFEIDGRRQRTWCRNLCLLSKMFLDHKTLYYDVDPFLFYVMTSRDHKGFHLVGYFSKEKESADGYNVACILTLPQFQRKGYGRLLIQFSYELSAKEMKTGSPEKPLSDLGLLSYRQYWTENLVKILLEKNAQAESVSIESLSQELAMTTQDVESTLQALKMQVYHKGEHKIILPTHVIQKYEAMMEKHKIRPRRQIDPSKIHWTPPVFNASSRTWGW
ncbi:Histone acetyltransferase [Podosphaera aphanis]|nr:Histone acetyltransferase [Podosphaera aphanis]